MIYQSLDVSRFEARLLRLLDIPPDPLEPLRFETITCSLIRPPEYFALSYCWGDDTNKLPIEVNREIIHVTKNLAAALRHSDFRPGALIWADAVCINQHDVNEKAHQIRLMGLIYSKAQATAVWLGDEKRDTQYARTFLKEIDLDDDHHVDFVSGDKFMAALRNTRDPVRSLRGLHELLTRPYWERVWIIQEIAKARTVHVRCGSLCFDLRSVIASTEHVDNLSERSRILISTIQEFRLQESEARRGGLRMTLLQALIRSRYSLATNPRDKVYALLNLARDGNDLVPTPTYTEPVEEIFRELTMTFFQSPHPMEATILSSRAPLNLKSKAQPPWAVDWSNLAFNIPHWLTSNLSAIFNVSLKEKEFGIPTFSSDSVKLPGQGQLLGSIGGVDNTLSEPTVQFLRKEHQRSISVMRWLSSSLFRLFIPDYPGLQTIPWVELTSALAHVITHTDKLNTESKEGACLNEVSRLLGELLIDSLPIQVWALAYLTSEKSHTVKMATHRNRDAKSSQLGSSFMNMSRFKHFERNSFMGSNQPPTFPFQFWGDALATLDLSLECGLRFAISGGNIVLVPQAAQTGDVIYRLDYCHFPMVLREIAEGPRDAYKIIGEACIGMDSDGQWIAARDCLWSTQHQLENLDLLV